MDERDRFFPLRLNQCRYCDHNDVLRERLTSSGYECYPRVQQVILTNHEDLNENLCLVEEADSPKGQLVLHVQDFHDVRAVDELVSPDLSE